MAELVEWSVTQVIELLLLDAGRIMEDASVGLALASPDDPLLLEARIVDLAADASEISALAAVAQILQRDHSSTV